MAGLLDLDDGLARHLCLALDPKDWCALRAAHPQPGRLLGITGLQQLFDRRLWAWRAAGGRDAACLELRAQLQEAVGRLRLGRRPSAEAVEALARAVFVVNRVLSDVLAHPRLMQQGLLPLHSVLQDLHSLVLEGKPRVPKERRRHEPGREAEDGSYGLRLALRRLPEEPGACGRLVELLSSFSPGSSDGGPAAALPKPELPAPLLEVLCDLLSVVMQKCELVKLAFLSSGGHAALLRFLRRAADDAAVQVAGLTVLVAVSACSERCVEELVSGGCHELAIEASRRFPGDVRVVSRLVSLLANMSNVPDVCPALRMSGAGELAEALCVQPLGGDEAAVAGGDSGKVPEPSEDQILFIKEFALYLKDNLA